MSDARILLLGKDGQLGNELNARLGVLGDTVSYGRRECDLLNLANLREILSNTKPQIIVNAAAYTAVDRAEAEQDQAQAVNAHAVAAIAEYALAMQATVVHYSTDYVFDGCLKRPYCESDSPNPISVYGKSKLAGEEILAQSGCRYLIFRTSWVYGCVGSNFLKTMLGLMMTRGDLSVIADQWGAPTSTSLIADVSLLAIRDRLSGMCEVGDGVYHLTAAGQASWHGYACYIAERAAALGFPLQMSQHDIRPIISDEFPHAAARPKNSLLNHSRIEEALGVVLPNWQSGVDATLAMLLSAHRFFQRRGG